MSQHRINPDQLHEYWLEDFVQFSVKYLGVKHEMRPAERAVLFVDHEENNMFEFKAVHEFAVPAGTGALALHHARFAQTILPFHAPEGVVNIESFTHFPMATFCLSSLLAASFPRNPKTQIFKRTVAGTMVLSLSDDEIADRPESLLSHLAFAGIGVTLMKKVRSLLCPLATDQETIETADGYYIAMLEP